MMAKACECDEASVPTESGSELLARILRCRRAEWKGRGKYKEPVAPKLTGLPNLPNDWAWASLDQLLLNITDGDHQPPPQTEHGVPFLVIGNVRSGKIEFSDSRFVSHKYADAVDSFRKPAKGDILYSLVGSYGIAIKVVGDEEFCIQRHLAVLRPHSLSPVSFLAHILNSLGVFQQATRVATGTAQKTVPLAGLRQFAVPLPPFLEQRRIVAEIEKQFTRLEAGVTALRQVRTKLKRYRAAILKAACEGRLVPTEAELARQEARPYEPASDLLARILNERRANWPGKGRHPEPERPDLRDLPVLPEGWDWATMPQLGEINRGKSKHRPRDDSSLFNGPYPFIQTGDIRRSRGTIREHTQTYSELGLGQSKLWPAGTLCITIAANIAETGILTYPACFPDSVVGFIQSRLMTTRFVELFLRTAKDKFEAFAPATAQKNINMEVLSKVAIPLPPFAEQTRIVAEVERLLSVVDKLEVVVAATLMRVARLRQSILQRAFSGRL